MRGNFVTLALALAACSSGTVAQSDGAAPSGSGSSRSYPVTGFTAVDLAGSDDVAVRVGPAFSVRAEGAPEVLDRLRIARDGDALSVGRKPGRAGSGPGSARVLVTLPRLAAATIAGSGNLSVDQVAGEAFRGSVAGSGDLRLDGLAVRSANLRLTGSGGIAASGRAERLEVAVTGSGDVSARGLTARSAAVNVTGSGDVAATVDGPATVGITGSGNADLGPRARCEVRRAGSGSARCGG